MIQREDFGEAISNALGLVPFVLNFGGSEVRRFGCSEVRRLTSSWIGGSEGEVWKVTNKMEGNMVNEIFELSNYGIPARYK